MRDGGKSKSRASKPRVIKPKPKGRHAYKVVGKTLGQKKYITSIQENVVTLCSGYAGTGKTVIAIGMALSLVQSENTTYAKIIVVRPAVEACGEKIGFLPGGVADKMRPLIQPVVDNLRVFIKDEGYLTGLLEGGPKGPPLIEVIPMAYLRGRTFNNCVVVFDEAQNSSPQQMKLFLTRIGEGSKVIIEGDITQSDINSDMTKNGLFDAIARLGGVKGVGIALLDAKDIQRSKIIGPILKRYEDVGGL